VSGRDTWERCTAACNRLLEALDWKALGEIYFHWGGEQFWQQRRPRVVEYGLRWARALMGHLTYGARSLHVGAGVAELPVLLAETMVRGRSVVATNLRGDECAVLNAGLQRCDLQSLLQFEARDAADVAAAAPGTFEHLGCVSLFTDPETFPLLSDVTYGRIAPVQVDVELFVAERERARALAQRLFAALLRPGWISTTAEELAWFLELIEAAGGQYRVEEEMIDTAVVGDPVGFVRVG